MTTRRTRSRLAALTALAGLSALAAPAIAERGGGVEPSFGVPRIVDPIHAYGEPDIAVNPKTGAIHTSGPQGTGTQRSVWNVSVDNGDSYRIVQNVPQNLSVPAITPTKSLIAPGGGDTDIAIASNGQAFFNDLAALVCFSSITTKDDGATTSMANPAGCSDPGADRQWIALFDPQPADHTVSPYKGPTPLAYMEYQGQVGGNDIVDASTDGIDYSHRAGTFAGDGVHRPNHTPIIVDQHTGKVLGLTSNGSSNSLALAVGSPDAKGDLTFDYTRVADNLAGNPQTLFPVLTEDSARTLYAVWIDHTTYQVWYSFSPVGTDDTWMAWSAPQVLSQAPANVNVFPWAQAGGPGILDVAWYGTDQTLAQLGTSGPSAQKGQAWNLFFSQLTDADSARPQVRQVTASPHPMHYNDICLLGTACITGQGNRNQADFFKLVIGADGRARIIYTDSSNRLSQAANTDTALDHQGAALDTVVTQNTGRNAWTGQPLKANDDVAPRSSVSDPAGDALFRPLGGRNVPGGDITGVQVEGAPGTLLLKVRTAAPLSGVPLATGAPFGELVVRWQRGDTLYHAGIETTASGALTAYAGRTTSVDLCSVSGCKPNYLDYSGTPGSASVTAAPAPDGGVLYTLAVPLAAIGAPQPTDLLEEMSAFVTASLRSAATRLDNAAAFADEVPLQIEGTRTFNTLAGGQAER